MFQPRVKLEFVRRYGPPDLGCQVEVHCRGLLAQYLPRGKLRSKPR
jgi:hypothetical protein